ncbi:hypothetical protein BKA82DRAFT_132735 [Pisolithus tinctorius]|uniref:Uncharacterized protein n=1 Tax=Pisolithus tinctorius Marx 270 TaxID=870435 RepID=A0A0C3PK43_PISTI|nr:hypothetical protein BKA82DRAFT_132735 [Pisolithus tinctorius]KIO08996.1 hypothetical protein M404DRAFT_132735 [Pisolithus tinctorius Marx 270]
MNPAEANKDNGVRHSKPIPIVTHHLRHRSLSAASDSSPSPASPPSVQTPSPGRSQPLSPSSAPIFPFLSHSPAKASATFPFRGFGPPVFEDEAMEKTPGADHARRSSISGVFAQKPAVAEVVQHERGVNILRRLSFGSAKNPAAPSTSPPQPAPPPNTAVSTSPVIPTSSFAGRKPKRSATVTESGRPRRAPSPMGERILKGHFDSFI